MIKISSATYTPTTGIGPFIYSWASANTCVTFSNPTGTVASGASFSTDVFVTDLTCFDYGTDSIQLTLVQEDGCETIHMFYPTNPCLNVSVSDIGQGPNELDFSATASGGSPPYAFSWAVTPAGTFNISVLNTSSNAAGYSSIHLTPVKGTKQPKAFTVFCTITDDNGCRAEEFQTFGLGGPIIFNKSVRSACIYEGNAIPNKFNLNPGVPNVPPVTTSNTYSAGPMLLFAEANPGCPADWSTLELSIPDPDIQVDITSSPPSVTLWGIKESSFNAEGLLSIPYSVKDCKGVASNEAMIIISKVDCIASAAGCPLIVDDLCIHNCDDTFTINLDDLIKSPNCCSTNSVDWSTFDVNAGTPQPPATVEFNGATHSLTYTANGTTNLSDLITWSISDALGNHSGIKYIQIARVCPENPSCSDDCYYVSSNAVDHPLHVLDNDSGPNLVESTLIITEIPTHGTAYVSDGDIFYTPFAGYEGADTLNYKIFNSDGLSCEATVTLNIAENGPAGTGNTIITCTDDLTITAEVDVEGVDATGKFDVVFSAYLETSDPLEDGDELDVEIIVSGTEIASATLVVGEDFTTTVKTGTDDNWLTGDNFAQYLTADVLTYTELVTGQTIVFDKKTWAYANNYINAYEDDFKAGAALTNAKEVVFKMKARSVSNGIESLFDSDIVEKVKVFSFEDTYHLDEVLGNANNSGTWSWEGAAGTKNKGETCNTGTCNEGSGAMTCSYHGVGNCGLASWYSQSTVQACAGYGTAELKNLVAYKVVGSTAVTGLSTAFTTEADLATVLNALNGTWQMTYINYNALDPTHNLWGHQATYLNSKYMLVSAPELEYFIIEYMAAGSCNEGIQARCTTTSHILF